MRFEILLSKDNQFYFVLKARNGETIAISEMYLSKQMCRKGINSVRRNAIIARIDDKTFKI